MKNLPGRSRFRVRPGSSPLAPNMDTPMKNILLSSVVLAASLYAQPGILTKQLLIEYTPEWKGERFADGRPKVSDSILKRMHNVTLEEAWAVLREAGFNHQYEDGWFVIHPDKVMVGRALTAQWLPGRPDIHRVIDAKGKKD